jgi:hypothetical protein
MCIVVFCSTQLAITLRRRLPPAISILVLLPGLLARVTIAEYVLICLPATWSLFELSHLVYQSVQEKGQEPIPAYMPKDYKEKDHVFA